MLASGRSARKFLSAMCQANASSSVIPGSHILAPDSQNQKASSVKSVGELRLRKLAKHVIQGELSDSEGAKPVGFSHGHFDLVV